MADTTRYKVRIRGVLCDHVAAQIGSDGLYANANEYVRDLIRRDLERTKQRSYAAL